MTNIARVLHSDFIRHSSFDIFLDGGRMSQRSRLLQACRLEKVDCTPVWFMRQAGRYMPEYRQIREKYGLSEMFKTPELAVEVTLQPVKAFEVDAAIIFADILLPLEGMGIELEFVDGEGPIIHNPVRTAEQVAAVRVPDPEEHLSYVLTSLRWAREELNDRIPLIGFAGAPFTLASYMIEGGASRNFLLTKKMMYEAAPAWHMLMSKLVQALSAYLLAQARAGAQVIQVFDSWVGCLGPADYCEYVHPHTKKLFDALREAQIPTIHFGTGTADLLPLMREAGGEVLGVDWRTHLDEAWNRIGPNAGIQGNLDPVTLIAPRPILQARAKEILDRVAGRAGHIFNLGHGILPLTPVDSIKALVAYVHEYSAGRT